MATAINLEPRQTRDVKAHRVFLKSRWSDAWVRIPFLFATEVIWSLAPNVGAASLSWRFGRGQRQGELNPSIIARLNDKRRQFIKIEIDTTSVLSDGSDVEPLVWYGTIELDGRVRQGLYRFDSSTVYDTGVQQLAALGIEQAFYRHPLRGATWLNSSGGEVRADCPYVFNKPDAAGVPRGNRSADKGIKSFVFSSKTDGEDKVWTTREIVKYLLSYEKLTGPGGAVAWTPVLDPDAEDLLPDWDKPVIDMQGQTLGDLLNLLMPRSRMLSWQLTFVTTDLGGDEFDAVFLTPVSLFGDDVATDLGTLKKAKRQITLQSTLKAEGSPEVHYALRESDIPQIDQARVRGALRTTTLTLGARDSTIDEGWSTTLENEYNSGASGQSGYSSLKTSEKRDRDEAVRDSDKLLSVYRRFVIPRTWNQKVKDGTGSGSTYAAFMKTDGNTADARLVNPRNLQIAPTLPLQDGFNYSSIGSFTNRTPPTKVSDGPYNRLPALVLFENPQSGGGHSAKYTQVEHIATASASFLMNHDGNRNWSGRVSIPAQDRAVMIDVHGQPQHVLAFTDFVALTADGPSLGKWDWRNALFTVCLYDEKYAEGVYPTDSDTDSNVEGVRREMVVNAGDVYKLDYIVPGTVIGLDNTTGGIVRCTNGGWANDDRKVLNSRARQIYEYYGTTRRALKLSTSLVSGAIQLGDYVVSLGRSGFEKDVGTVISEIAVSIPSSDRPQAPRIEYTTAFAELDSSELLNRPAVPERSK